ncbi:DedA family protein [Falsiroseomonas sp. HW251]|uniref:DedA family protein n=1 Tax=Falsiroseomonas sp. HW251 TaxID=3390998 RepID=UPI003D319B8B
MLHLDGAERLLDHWGYAGVFAVIMLESLGVPAPGESLLVAAAAYAAATGRIDIAILVPAAAAGAILGDQIGYLIGRAIGLPLLHRLGRRVGLTEDRLLLGTWLFRRYGGRLVFLGRFVALLRTVVAVMAGANGMHWASFAKWNALGGIAWTSLYGFGTYFLGDVMARLHGPVGIAIGACFAIAAVAGLLLIRKHETLLVERARAEIAEQSKAAKA